MKITYPGTAGVGHQWAYLPDAAETIVGLVEKSAELETFAVFHMEGHWDKDGTRMDRASMAADAALVAFVPLFRELAEVRYLWQLPVRMGNERLTAVLGAEPHTPLDTAVRTTLLDLGCLAA